MIRVVCLDLDGVFFKKVHPNLIKNLAQRFDLNEEFLKKTLFVAAAQEGGYNDLKCGKIPSEKYWGWLLKKLGLEGRATKVDFLEELLQGYQINPQASKLVDALHTQKIKTAICSNNYQDNIEMLSHKFNLAKYFDIMVFSYEVGVMKPDKRIFQVLLNRAGVEPQELVYSDDEQENVETARELGINAFIYEDFSDLTEQLAKMGIKLDEVDFN